GATIAAETGKIKLMQQGGIERRHLLLLQPADDVSGRRLRIERSELLRNGVQASNSAAVVILIVTFDQPWRDAVECPRAAEKRRDLVTHLPSSPSPRGRRHSRMPSIVRGQPAVLGRNAFCDRATACEPGKFGCSFRERSARFALPH